MYKNVIMDTITCVAGELQLPVIHPFHAGWPLYANHTTNLPCVEVHPKKNGPHKIFVEIDVLEDIPINEAMYANTEKQQQQQYQPLLRTESLHQVYKEVDKIPHNRVLNIRDANATE